MKYGQNAVVFTAVIGNWYIKHGEILELQQHRSFTEQQQLVSALLIHCAAVTWYWKINFLIFSVDVSFGVDVFFNECRKGR